MKKTNTKKILPICITCAIFFCALYCFVTLCRLTALPLISILDPSGGLSFYLTPNEKQALIRSCIFPNLVCGMLTLLWELMEDTKNLRHRTVALLFGFALFPLIALAVLQLCSVNAASQICSAIGFPLCTLSCTALANDIFVSKKDRPALAAAIGILLCGLCLFSAVLTLRFSLFLLYLYMQLSAPLAWSLLSLCFFFKKPSTKSTLCDIGLFLCAMAYPVYLCINPFDRTGLYSVICCALFLLCGAALILGFLCKKRITPHAM